MMPVGTAPEALRDDVRELRRCICDLLALSALPALWKNHDARQIAESVAEALVSMLDAEFVHLRLPLQSDEPVVQVTRTRGPMDADAHRAIHQVLSDRPSRRSPDGAGEIENPLGGGIVRIASAPIGLASDAVLVAGSVRSGFPTDIQDLILRMGANQTAIAVDRWYAEADQRRFVALVERSSDFIAVASLGGVPQYMNPAGLRRVGLDGMDQARRMHVLDYVVPEERARIRDQLWPVVMRDGRWVGELAFRHFKTGAAIPFLVDWFRIDDTRTGRPMNVATVSVDLTAQKEAEDRLLHLNDTLEQRVAERTAEIEDANRRLLREKADREWADDRLRAMQQELFHAARLSAAGQMAAALAHELNQPLTAAANFMNAARRGLADVELREAETVREDMEDAAGQVLRAGQIIRRLREFASRGKTEKRSESILNLIQEAAAFVLAGAGTLRGEIRFRFDPEATLVLADRIQVQQVLVNLIRNALEAVAESRRRELVVTTSLLDRETVEIAIADSGPGLAADTLDHLFEPFFSTKERGMGLGLSISRTIVESHGGRIEASENPGGGLVFRFTLPMGPADEFGDAG
jgi:PAS domain S-box-containing protein